MSMTDATVRDFGRAMGMPGLAFNEAGVLRLNFENAGVLSIERARERAVVHLARPVTGDADTILVRALELCHFDAVEDRRADAGMARNGSLVFSLVVDEKDLDLPTLENVFDLLRRLHDRAAR